MGELIRGRFLLSPHPQDTEEWKRDRAGKVTGSRADCVGAKGSGSTEATTRRDYRVQLVVERLTGEPQEDAFTSRYLRAGKENEPFARMKYEEETGAIVRQVGLAYLPSMPVGCSVDGLMEDDPDGFGFLEIKCPKSANHIAYLMAARLPPEHVPQVVHNFYVTSADFCDFASYDPHMPEKLRLFKVRVYRKEVELDMARYEKALLQFLAETKTLETQLRRRAA